MRLRLIIWVALVAALVPALALASPLATKKYQAALIGSSVVPKQGPAGGKGSAHFTLNGLRLCWKITVSGIDSPVAAHVHTGGGLSTGPVIVSLGRRFTPAGCAKISGYAAITIDGCRCGGVYVDVHTKKFPKGALRGDLEVSR